MKLIHLNKNDVTALYHERMVNDFIENELKPLWVIHNAMDEGNYEPLGLSDGAELYGYTFLVRLGRNYLVDYLAIFRDVRNQGIGSEMLGLLGNYLADAEMIMLEVEDPAFAENEVLRNIQERRIKFYNRNGWSDTGLRVKYFNVPFIVLKQINCQGMDWNRLWEIYQAFYRSVLPKKMFDENIKYLDYNNEHRDLC